MIRVDDATRRQRLLAWAEEHIGELEADLILAGWEADAKELAADELCDAAYARLIGEGL